MELAKGIETVGIVLQKYFDGVVNCKVWNEVTYFPLEILVKVWLVTGAVDNKVGVCAESMTM